MSFSFSYNEEVKSVFIIIITWEESEYNTAHCLSHLRDKP